jgi:hypothetical protein
VLLSNQGERLLYLGPFCHKVRQSLELDRRLRDVCYVKPHEFESPLGNPFHGEAISDNFPEPMLSNHMNWVALKVMQELMFNN